MQRIEAEQKLKETRELLENFGASIDGARGGMYNMMSSLKKAAEKLTEVVEGLVEASDTIQEP